MAKRPALDRLMDDARKRRFDMVGVWRFDRFARSTKHLVTALEEFQHLSIDFISYSENIDPSSPMGKAMFTIVAAIAELVKGRFGEVRVRQVCVDKPVAGHILLREVGVREVRPP